MNFLAAILAKIVEWLVGLAVKAIERWNRLRLKDQAIEARDQQILDQTEKARTEEERQNAAKDTIHNGF